MFKRLAAGFSGSGSGEESAGDGGTGESGGAPAADEPTSAGDSSAARGGPSQASGAPAEGGKAAVASSFSAFFRKAADVASTAATSALAAANKVADLDRLKEEADGGEGGAGNGAAGGPGGAAAGGKRRTGRRRSSAAQPPRFLPAKYDSLDVTYVSRRVIVMGFPVFKAPKATRITRGNKGPLVAQCLAETHGGHFMVWNLSEDSYDDSLFDNQVMEMRFPGHPAPPLGILFKMVTAMQSWLDADPENVAVIHCMTGRGRSVVAAACFLAWMGEFHSPMEALNAVCERRGSSLEAITIPSQRRYTSYFSFVLDGVKPRSTPLVLRRVLVNGVPNVANFPGSSSAGGKGDAAEQLAPQEGCRPYLQLFRGGKMVYSSTWKPGEEGAATAGDGTGGGVGGKPSDGQLRWQRPDDGVFRFAVDIPMAGDMLLRCRHMPEGAPPVSLFRAAFHTGYVQEHVLRFGRAQLDCSSSATIRGSEVLPADMFVELIFAPVSAETEGADGDGAGSDAAEEGAVRITEADRDAFGEMLSSTSGFWEEVARRKDGRERRLTAMEAEAARVAEEERARDADSAADGGDAASAPDAGSGSSGGVDPTDVASPAVERFDLVGEDDDEGLDTSSRRTSTAAARKPVAAAPPAPPDEDEAELLALERELGLDVIDPRASDTSEGGQTGVDASADGGDVAAGDISTGLDDDDAEIAELESYLASISGSSPATGKS